MLREKIKLNNALLKPDKAEKGEKRNEEPRVMNRGKL